MDVPHDHDVGRVAQDPPEPLDLTALTQVLGRESVAEAVGANTKPDLRPDAAEEVRHRREADRFAVRPKEEAVLRRLRPPAVQVADQVPPESAADRDTTKLCPLAVADLEEGALTVVLAAFGEISSPPLERPRNGWLHRGCPAPNPAGF
jgi:hypothetical protein